MKKTVNPCDDFYQFSCGGWIEKTELPAEKSALYRQWSTLDDITDQKLGTVLRLYAVGDFSTKSRYAKKLGDFYAACFSSDKSNVLPVIEEKISKINAIKNVNELSATAADLQLDGANLFFSFYVGQDVNDSSKMTVIMDQGGMGLPERDYYLRTDHKSKKIRRAYRKHIAKMLRLSGYPVLKAFFASHAILKFETKLAAHALAMDDRRDPAKTNNPMDLAKLKTIAPAFNWNLFFETLGAKGLNQVNVSEPDFFKNMDVIATDQDSLKTIKDYMVWQFVHSSAQIMGGDFEKENFAFWGKTLKGKKEMEPRWKVCTHLAGSSMRDALAEAFVAMNDGEGPKKKTNEMIDLVKETFASNLERLDWIDSPTRAAAQDKINKLNRKVAYPDVFRNYDEVVITRENALKNELSATRFESKRMIAKIGQAVDRTNWDMPAWEANAYYDPTMNEFVFPLGELLPPVLDLKASDGANYGALGATIGHELTHGFDDEGRQFDADGNLRDWWTAGVKKQFEEKANCYVAQANKYEVLPGLFVNGKATLGENLADQGGTKLAWLAYRKLAEKRPPAAPLDGYSEDQQYFISYAQSWCGKMRPEALRVQVTTDVHPPTDFRVNAVVMNMPEFAKAFGCKDGTKMAPVNRCSLW